MKKAVFLLLLFTGPAWADVKVVGPAKIDPYKLVVLAVEGATPDAAVVWDVTPEEFVDSVEAGLGVTFVAPPGEYKVKARVVRFVDGKVKVETAKFVVTIGVPTPPPPPAPPPVPPVTDPLTAALQTAYNAEPAATRSADLAALLAIYRNADAVAAVATTWKQALDGFHAVVQLKVGDRLPAVRKAIQAELQKTLPAADGPIDKALYLSAHAKIAAALGGVK